MKRAGVKARTKKRRVPEVSENYRKTRDRWEEFRERLESEYKRLEQSRTAGHKFSTFDQPDAMLLRKIYKFTKEYLDSDVRYKLFENAIEHEVNWGRISNKPMVFKNNPFLLVMFSYDLSAEPQIGKVKRSRMAAQMQYAYRHNIPPEYIIGFIYQSGGVNAVCAKAKKPDVVEDWYRDRNAATSSMRTDLSA